MRGALVEMSAVVSESPPYVTLHWNPAFSPVTGLTAYRRAAGATDWGEGFVLPPESLSVEDPWAVPGELFEYRIVREQDSALHPIAEGHLWAGVNVPAVESRGRIILVVDDSVAEALESEIDRLELDLVGDGWVVARVDVSRTASVVSVKTEIASRYAEDPESTKAVFLLGHVPVPYSGIVCPDGHWDPPPEAHHRGAWPTDAYYGDMDGVWTDTEVDYVVANVTGTRNHNVPGDGKFDQSLLVGEHLPELAVGRVDLANMEGVANGVSEVELLRRYLDRHHAFRHRLASFEALGNRALIDDNFANAFGISGGAGAWSSGIALFGEANVSAQTDWVAALRDQDYLLAFGNGPGSFTGAGGVSTSLDLRDTKCRAVFHLLFGSFFGDWDSADNYLRAPLMGTPESHGLVSVWAGVPRWNLFPLAAGGTMADAWHHVIRDLNQPEGPFPPADESWTNPDQAHVAIMGDPVLRSHPAKPVTDLDHSIDVNDVTLTWTNPMGDPNFLGCRIYRAPSAAGPFVRVGEQIGPTESSYTETFLSDQIWHYQVRALTLQTTGAGSYENLAQGKVVKLEIDVPEFAQWAEDLEDSSPSGDANADGVKNLLAYALGAPNGLQFAGHLVPSIGADGRFLVASSERSDVKYEAQLSRDLAQWFSVAEKPIGGVWQLNPTSGYPDQESVVLIKTNGAKKFHDASNPRRLFWRLLVGL